MLQFRILSPAAMTDDVTRILESDPAVSGLAVMRGASLRPAGDVVVADLTREAANDIVTELRNLGLPMRWCGPTWRSSRTTTPNSTGPI